MKAYFVFFLLSFCFISSSAVLATDNDEHDDDDELESVSVVDGQVLIHLPEAIQKSSGIQTQALQKIDFQAEYMAYGQAISASPLLSTLNQYQSLLAQQGGAQARQFKTEKALKRLRQLHQSEAVSSRKLQNQQSLWQTEKALYDELIYKSQSLINNSRLQWGEQLTQWLIDKSSPQLQKLLLGQATLLRLSLPAGKTLKLNNALLIHPSGNREQAFKASIIGLLPNADNFAQGLQYLLYCDDPRIKAGMNFSAWIPEQQASRSGFIIPKNALSWHLGQSFIFVKVADEQFLHRVVESPISVAKGYFISEQHEEDDQVVIKGTQMLLSHEFRSQIPDEDDD